MTLNHIYTTLSRATKLSHLHFKHLYFGTFSKEVEPEEPTEINMIKKKKGEIYELNNGDHYYIGQTKHTSEKRFQEHLSDKTDSIHTVPGNWICKKLVNVFYFDDDHLLNIETNCISKYQNEGKTLLNKQKLIKEEIKYKIQGPHIDERVKVKFCVEEYKGFILLKKKEDNKIKETKKVRYGYRKTKEQAITEIMNWKESLSKALDPVFTVLLN